MDGGDNPGAKDRRTGYRAAMLDHNLGQYVQVIEERQGLKIGSIEEVAWRQGFIDDAGLEDLARPLEKSGYGAYLLRLLEHR